MKNKTNPADKIKLLEIMTELRDFIDSSPLTERNQRACVEAQNLLRRVKNEFNTISCFKCGALIERSDGHIWYHGDQDDLICLDCAKETEHTDTLFVGRKVVEEKTKFSGLESCEHEVETLIKQVEEKSK